MMEEIGATISEYQPFATGLAVQQCTTNHPSGLNLLINRELSLLCNVEAVTRSSSK